MTVWILTEEYNEYDQHGEYFVAVFASKPTEAQLAEYGIAHSAAKHVLDGGGRIEFEWQWYHLREVTPE